MAESFLLFCSLLEGRSQKWLYEKEDKSLLEDCMMRRNFLENNRQIVGFCRKKNRKREKVLRKL
jgi:hypothetical protein